MSGKPKPKPKPQPKPKPNKPFNAGAGGMW